MAWQKIVLGSGTSSQYIKGDGTFGTYEAVGLGDDNTFTGDNTFAGDVEVSSSTTPLLALRSSAGELDYSGTIRFCESTDYWLGGYIQYDGSSGNNKLNFGTHDDSNELTSDDVIHMSLPRDDSGDVIFAGTIKGSAGSVGSPAIILNGDTDTGFYYSGANDMGVSVAGTLVGRFVNGSFKSGGTNGGWKLMTSSGAGSAGLPPYSFEGDEDTGMYRTGADAIGFTVGGVKKVEIAADGHLTAYQKFTCQSDFRQTYGDAQFYSTLSVPQIDIDDWRIKDNVISADTADGSDNKELYICSGGAQGYSRGAYIDMLGNDYATWGGMFHIVCGDGANGSFRVSTGENLRLTIAKDGDATFGGELTVNGGRISVSESGGSQAYLYSGGSFTVLRTTSNHSLRFGANYDSRTSDDLIINTDGSATFAGNITAVDGTFTGDVVLGDANADRRGFGPSGLNSFTLNYFSGSMGHSWTGGDGYGTWFDTGSTPSADRSGNIVRIKGSITEASSGTNHWFTGLRIDTPTVTTAGATVTNSALLRLDTPMSNATNNYSIYSASGDSYFGGNATFAGTINVPDGSVSAPSIANTGETDTGIYFPATDTLAFGTGGVERGFIGATGKFDWAGDADFDGKVTITSTTENSILVLNPTDDNWGGLVLQYGGSNKGMCVYNSSNIYVGGESGTGTIIQAGGGNALQFSATAPYNATFAGSVTIPEYIYHSGDTDTSIRFDDDRVRIYAGADVAFDYDESSASTLGLSTNGQADISFGGGNVFIGGSQGSYDGKVGIGTASPSYELDVRGGGATTLQVKSASNSDDTMLKLQSNAYYFNITNQGSGGHITYMSDDNQDQIWYTDNASNSATERFRIEGGGNTGNTYFSSCNVGIGTDSPDGKLAVQSAALSGRPAPNGGADELVIEGSGDSGLTIFSENSNSGKIAFGDQDNHDIGRIIYDHSEDDLSFWTYGVERVTIASSGNVGIGTVSPNAKLEIQGTNRSTAFAASTGATWHDAIITNPNGTAGSSVGLMFQTSGYHANAGTGIAAIDAGGDFSAHLAFITRPDSAVAEERMRITDAGNVGIGTDSPSSILHLKAATNPVFRVEDSTNGATTAMYTGDTVGYMGTITNHQLKILQNDAVAITIATDKAATFAGGITVAGVVNATGSGDNISEGLLWAKGGVRLTSSFGETLDSYEEGTWTPALNESGTSSTSATNRYTRIGNVVHLWGHLSNIQKDGTPTSDLEITGLPFSCEANATVGTAMTNNITTASKMVNLSVQVNTSNNLYFYQTVYNGAWVKIDWSAIEDNDDIYFHATYRTDA